MALNAVLQAVNNIRAPQVRSEYDLHDLLASALREADLPYRHEVMVAPRCRVDFLVQGIAVEVKRSRPNAKALLAQATRYLASPLVHGLIVVSEKSLSLPQSILNKPCINISLNQLWGLAVPEGGSGASLNTSNSKIERMRRSVIEEYEQKPSVRTPASLPPYLQEPDNKQQVFGTLSYQKRGNYWVIKGDPAVTEMAKRLFPGANAGQRGSARFVAHRRLVGELNWLMQRYPLAVMPADQERWQSALLEAQQHHLRQEAFRLAPPSYQDTSGFFQGKLRSFQETGVNWLLHNPRALLADEMGLGKTVQALAALSSASALPAMVVVPPHLISNWNSEIQRFLSIHGKAPRVHIIKGLKPYSLPEADIYLIHYLLLRGWKEHLPRLPLRAVIFDEIQELRHRGSEKYSAASLLASANERVWGLSGTPIYNHGGEIWNVVNILDFHLLGDWESFTREWCYAYGNAIVVQPDWLGAHLRREGLMLRRTKKEVLKELPDKRRLVQQIDADDVMFDRLMEPVVQRLQGFVDDPQINPSQAALMMDQLSQAERQASGIAKAPFVAQFIRALLDNGEKVLLFAHHHAVMDIYKKELSRHSPVFVTGRESQTQKDVSIKRFVEGKSHLCCISLRAASGLNLQTATCVVFGELDWSPAVHSQAEDRAHRMGQKDSLLCYYLVSSRGSDAVMQDALGLKVSQFMGLMGEMPAPQERLNNEAHLARMHVEDMARRWIGKASSPSLTEG